MSSTGVRVEGLQQTIRALQKFGVSVDDLKQAMQNIAQRVVEDAKALTPVRTGKLRDSIRASKAKNSVTLRGGTKKIYYGSFVEYGSVHNKAVAMVHNAAESNQGYVLAQLQNEIDSLINKYNLN